MQLCELKLDSTRSYMVHRYTGKKYPIKKQRGRYYIQHATGQLTVTSLIVEPEREYDIMTDYVLSGLAQLYPCYAMDFFAMKYRTRKLITIPVFKSMFNL